MTEEVKTPEVIEEEVPNTEETEFKKKPDEEEEEEKKNPPSDEKKDNDDSEDKKESDESKKDEEEDEEEKKKKKMNHAASNDEEEDEEKCEKCGKKKSECTCKKFSLEEIPEYVELQNNYSALEEKYNALVAEIEPLRTFKAEADKREKQAMIDSFYMLSDADKAEVIANIDTYSVNDIEAKLAIICVRNKVNFSLDEDKKEEPKDEPLVYSLNNTDDGDSAPAWIKAVRDTAKTMI